MADLPIAPVKRIIKSTGNVRVSDDAASLLASHLKEQGSIVAENATAMAKHAGRKTVTASDVKLAIKTLYD